MFCTPTCSYRRALARQGDIDSTGRKAIHQAIEGMGVRVYGELFGYMSGYVLDSEDQATADGTQDVGRAALLTLLDVGQVAMLL